MSEIEFRAWNDALPALANVLEIRFNQHALLTDESKYLWDLDRIVLEQYTGLKDVNGVEIYEGDIVKAFHNYIDTVVFRLGCFGFDANHNHPFTPLCNLDGSMEVIGNVHQNPELLEG